MNIKVNSYLLRKLRFLNKKNGFDECEEQSGNKVVINQEKFYKWIKESTGNSK